MNADTEAEFTATRWTIIDALHGPDEAAREAAMDALAHQYWPPVYAHLRHLGRTRQDAADLTQGFFADVVLRRKLLERARRREFRLRSLLVHALKNFLIDQHRRPPAKGKSATVPLDRLDNEEMLQATLNHYGETDVTAVFDRRWAVVVLHEALARCERHLKSYYNQEKLWVLFEAHVIRPSAFETKPVPLQELADQFGFGSYGDAIEGLRKVRKQLKSVFIRQVIAETNSKPEDQEEEYRMVISMLP